MFLSVFVHCICHSSSEGSLVLTTLQTKMFDILCFKTFALSLRSRRQHKAWGVSPRRGAAKRSEPTKWATANGCRPFHGLDGAPNLTWGCGLRLHPRLYSAARSAGLNNTKKLNLQST